MTTPDDAREMRESYANGNRYLSTTRSGGMCYICGPDHVDPDVWDVIKLRDGLADVVAEVLKLTGFAIDHENADIELTASYVAAQLHREGVNARVSASYDVGLRLWDVDVHLAPINYTSMRGRAEDVCNSIMIISSHCINVH